MEKREELQQEKKKWLEEVYGKICTKMSEECTRVGDRIPYIPENGRYEGDLAETDVCWWTNGFWGGIRPLKPFLYAASVPGIIRHFLYSGGHTGPPGHSTFLSAHNRYFRAVHRRTVRVRK